MGFLELERTHTELSLHTVCREAACPNIFECWEDREATFLILGTVCTRRCGFCDVITGKPGSLDRGEPLRVADAVARMALRYATVTGVARDDLPDGGASVWAETILAIRARVPGCSVEVLTPDFRGANGALEVVLGAKPEVFGHNIETVRRLHRLVRPGFNYERSLQVLRRAKGICPDQVTKSNLMLGLGESLDEVLDAMTEIRRVGCDLLTINQYLRPSKHHLPVQRWVPPAEFSGLARAGMAMGFKWVEAGPLVRSSYRAARQLARARHVVP